MIAELLCGLVGIPGAIVDSAQDGSLGIASDCECTSPERVQILKLLTLGTMFRRLKSSVKSGEFSWMNNTHDSDCSLGVYNVAICDGVSEVLSIYMEDLVLVERAHRMDSITVTYLLQYLQKYLLVFPVLCSICLQVREPNCRGGKVIDIVAKHRCGIRLINDVVDRILHKLHIIFAKHSIGWMLHGYLDPLTSDFFIQQGSNMYSQYNRTHPDVEAKQYQPSKFDWNNSFSIDTGLVPRSLVAPSLISKIFFAGKAILLMTSGVDFSALKFFKYFSPNITRIEESISRMPVDDLVVEANGLLQEFQSISNMEIATSGFERLVISLHDRISTLLWDFLRDRCKFMDLFKVIRNTYFFGKGEFYQSIVDKLLHLTEGSVPDINLMDRIIASRVVGETLKQLSPEDDSPMQVFGITTVKPYTRIGSFTQQQDEYVLFGSAALQAGTPDSSIIFQRGPGSKSGQVKWGEILFGTNDPESLIRNSMECETRSTLYGSMWVNELRPVTKGFFLTATYDLNFAGILRHHRQIIISRKSGDVAVASVCVCIKNPKSFLKGTENDLEDAIVVCFKFSVKGEAAAELCLEASVYYRPAGVEVSSKSLLWSNPTIKLDIGMLNLDVARFVVEVESKRKLLESSAASIESALVNIQNVLVLRLSEFSSENDIVNVSIPVDITELTFFGDGDCRCGFSVEALNIMGAESASICLKSFEFKSSTANPNYSFVSPFTAVQNPAFLTRCTAECRQIRSWITLQPELRIPYVFSPIFDGDSKRCYEKMFSVLLKIRLVAHALERIWITEPQTNRIFNFVRHSMHFFLSNLLYYIQVDVIDCECSEFEASVSTGRSFVEVLRAHRTMLANICRLSLVDNTMVQDCIERILHSCIRFVSLCRLMNADASITLDFESKIPLPSTIPSSEVNAIRGDFFGQVTFLHEVMKKMDNRGFLFRLDFNGYITSQILS